MSYVTQEIQDQVSELYIAFFNRAPDAAGFGFWAEALASGVTPNAIAAEFAKTPEAVSTYGGLTPEQQVSKIYLNVLGRTADPEGLAYWTEQIVNGTPFSEFAYNFVNTVFTGGEGIAATDTALVQNKVTVAEYFAIDLASNDGALAATAFVGVTADPATVDAKEAELDAAVNAGTTYTLTTGIDTIIATAPSVTFNAPLAVNSSGTAIDTLNTYDELVGLSGTNVLNAQLVGGTAAGSPILTNIENLFIRARESGATSTLDLTNTDSAEQVWNDRSVANLTISNVQNSVILGVASVSGSTYTVDYASAAGTVASQTIVLNGASAVTLDVSAAVTTGSFDELTIEAVTADSSGIVLADLLTGATSLTINATAGIAFATGTLASLTDLTVTGDGDVDLSAMTLTASAGTAAITIDATAASADLELVIQNTNTAALTADFGEGDNLFEMTAYATGTAAVASVDLGDGDDALLVSATLLTTTATNVALEGGLGEDTLGVSGPTVAADLNGLDFAGASGFEVLAFVDSGTVAITAAAELDLSDLGYEAVVFEGLVQFGATTGTAPALDILGLEDNATIVLAGGLTEAVATDATNLTIDNGGSLTFDIGADVIVAGTDATDAASLTFENATSLVFDITDATATVDVGLTLTDLDAGSVSSISVIGGAGTDDSFTLDLGLLATTGSDLSSLTTVDFSSFVGTVAISLDAGNGVITDNLTINLFDGSAAGTVATATVATLTASERADTFVFSDDLLGLVAIDEFTSGFGGDVLNVANLGVTSISQLTIAYSGTNAAEVTSTLFDGSIEVTFAGSATTFTADNFIFA